MKTAAEHKGLRRVGYFMPSDEVEAPRVLEGRLHLLITA
jgi:hypothetical protein